MVFINETSAIGGVVVALTGQTGSPFIAYLVIWMMLIFFCVLFRMGVFETLIIVTPLTIVLMANNGDYYAIGGLVLISLAVFFAKNWFVPAR